MAKGVIILQNNESDGGSEMVQMVLDVAKISKATYDSILAGETPVKKLQLVFTKTTDQYNAIRATVTEIA